MAGRAAGAGGLALTTIFGASLMGDAPTNLDELKLPVVKVDDALLAEWLSESVESFSDEPLKGECSWFNFSAANTGHFCDVFTISRTQSATISVASARALKCMASGKVECVLSTEIGLGVPAAFLGRADDPDGVKTLIAPRRVPFVAGDAPPKQRPRQHPDRHVWVAHVSLQQLGASRVPDGRQEGALGSVHRERCVLRFAVKSCV